MLEKILTYIENWLMSKVSKEDLAYFSQEKQLEEIRKQREGEK